MPPTLECANLPKFGCQRLKDQRTRRVCEKKKGIETAQIRTMEIEIESFECAAVTEEDLSSLYVLYSVLRWDYGVLRTFWGYSS